MRNGIFRDDEGFDILVNGIERTFRDMEEFAYAAGRFLKRHNPHDRIEIRVRATGQVTEILAPGS